MYMVRLFLNALKIRYRYTAGFRWVGTKIDQAEENNKEDSSMSILSRIAGYSAVAGLGSALALSAAPAGAAWQPTHNVEFIVPAGIGGGAGQMAQLI